MGDMAENRAIDPELPLDNDAEEGLEETESDVSTTNEGGGGRSTTGDEELVLWRWPVTYSHYRTRLPLGQNPIP